MKFIVATTNKRAPRPETDPTRQYIFTLVFTAAFTGLELFTDQKEVDEMIVLSCSC